MCGLRVTLVPEVFLASSRLWFSQEIKKNIWDRFTYESIFFTCSQWNPVDFPVCRFDYKKMIHVHD